MYRRCSITALLTILVMTWLGVAAPVAADDGETVPFLRVLGIAQDAGYPHIGCKRECCQPAWQNPRLRRYATSLAIVDPRSRQRWLWECTPDFPSQLRDLDQRFPVDDKAPGLDGILLTHAHMGHYTGLMHLGREALGGRDVAVYVMPRMKEFLKSQGPWSQLVAIGNIRLNDLPAGQSVTLNDRLRAMPLLVPHRDEYSETAGFIISGPQRRVLFIPDIDKWEKWDRRIEDVLATVDIAFLDGTFYESGELPGRDMAEIPHPFIVETMQRLAPLSSTEKNKIHFIHLNHSNRALPAGSPIREQIRAAGFHVATQGQEFTL